MTNTLLDPEFALFLKSRSRSIFAKQREVDLTKWEVANKVLDMWSEHQAIFKGHKDAYYIEASRVANEALEINLFGASGQTLRRWVEVAATYKEFPDAQTFFEATSFAHMEVCKKLYKDELLKSPILGLAEALAHTPRWSADDLYEFYCPPKMPPHEYDRAIGYLDSLSSLELGFLTKDKRKSFKENVAKARKDLER